MANLAAALAGIILSANAPSVAVEHGNIVLKGAGPEVKLTSSGQDSDPVLSPDGKRVVFTRTGEPSEAMKLCEMNDNGGKAVALWSVNSDGGDPVKLLDGHGAQDVEENVCDFAGKQFNAAGTLLYFETPAWATSDAIHVFDMGAKSETFLIAGNSLQVLSACKNADYRDAILASQHRYFVFGGSYDWVYLFKPDGKEVGPVGETVDQTILDDACAAS